MPKNFTHTLEKMGSNIYLGKNKENCINSLRIYFIQQQKKELAAPTFI